MWSWLTRNQCHIKKLITRAQERKDKKKELTMHFQDHGERYKRTMYKKLEEEIKNISLNISCNLFINKNIENIVIFFII